MSNPTVELSDIRIGEDAILKIEWANIHFDLLSRDAEDMNYFYFKRNDPKGVRYGVMRIEEDMLLIALTLFTEDDNECINH